MRKALFAGLLLILSSGLSSALAEEDTPRVRMVTSMGTVLIALHPEAAPRTVENFLAYVENDFYDGTVFHRVIDGFVVQGGGFDADYQRKQTRPPVLNEADNGLRNTRGTIAMARTFEPHSATSQFYINLQDNAFLDHRDKSPKGWGYAVFGEVVEGMEVLEAIGRVKTGPAGPFPQDAPSGEPVLIQDMVLVRDAGQDTQTEEAQ